MGKSLERDGVAITDEPGHRGVQAGHLGHGQPLR
jgi:hypothetical protein